MSQVRSFKSEIRESEIRECDDDRTKGKSQRMIPGSAMPIEIGTAIGPLGRSTTRESDNGITAMRIIRAMMHRTGGRVGCLAIGAIGMTLLVAACGGGTGSTPPPPPPPPS